MCAANRVVVIGAGAAGMMSAIQAAEAGSDVLLLERNGQAGKKLLITGKGRCNLTNNCEPEEFFSDGLSGDVRFLRSALSRFSPKDAMLFFERLGVPLVTERGRRVFPESGAASDVVSALTRRLDKLGVKRKRTRMTGLVIKDGRAVGVTTTDGQTLSMNAVIIATGGLSYPATGSTGDGYTFARQAGHTVTELSPSLVPLVSPDTCCAEMQGLSLRNVTFRLRDITGKTVFSEGPGEMLFTHFGISGPLVLSASAHYRAGMHGEIDLKPGLDDKQLDARILRDFQKFAARSVRNAFGELLHKTMIPVIISRSGISPEKKTAEVTRTERAALLNLIKRFPLTLSGTRPVEEAVITRGGVSLREVDPRTMESKLVKCLFFAGEVLDLDAYTGGYNLQIAWSTGWVAGRSAGGHL